MNLHAKTHKKHKFRPASIRTVHINVFISVLSYRCQSELELAHSLDTSESNAAKKNQNRVERCYTV